MSSDYPNFLTEAISKMRADGLLIDNPISDGKIHRCPTEGKPRGKDGAYIIHDDTYPVAWWQNWVTGITNKWQGKGTSDLTKKERQEYARRMKRIAIQEEAERKQKHEEVAKEARKIWEAAHTAPETQSYLKRKQVDPYICRINHRGNLLVPIYDPDGQLVNLQTVLPLKPGGNGCEKRYLTGGRKKDCYCPIPVKDTDADCPLLIAEGFATAASLAMATGFEVWIAFDAYNLNSVSKLARAKFPERKIVICADNDKPHLPNQPEQGGVGAHYGRKAAEAIGGYFALCPLYENHDKADFNDLACDLGLPRVQSEIDAILKSGPVTACIIPNDFILKPEGSEAGLYWKQPLQGGMTREVRIGDPLHILGYTRTGDGDNWGLLLSWKDRDGREHQYALPKSLLTGQRSEWLPLLADMGWTFDSAYKKQIARYLEVSTPMKRIRCVTATGWSGNRYVLPDCIYGEEDDPIVLQATGYKELYQSNGSLEEWQKIANLCIGNPKIGFAVSCSFAGPLLNLAGMDGGIFSFEGGSSCGKTTALTAAASVWGKPKFHVKKWRATDNSLEVTASLHNDGLLILDELGEADSRKLAETVYMLTGGRGKDRAARDGGLRKTYRWNMISISSGELGLGDKLREAGKQIRSGLDVRFISIPVSRDDITELHSMADSGLLVRQIKKLADTHYGIAGREFLKRLTQNETLQAAKTALQDGIENIADSFCPENCDGQVRRVALLFALVSIAGTLARESGILPAGFEAADYARKCFDEWLKQRGGNGPLEDMKILEQVRLFIEQHGQSRFQELYKDTMENKVKLVNPDAPCQNRAGYREDTIFFCLPETFKAEIVKGYSAKRAVEVLVEAGWLQKDGGRNTCLKWIPNLGPVRVYKLILPEEKEEKKVIS